MYANWAATYFSPTVIRIKAIEAVRDVIVIEYHACELAVNTELLQPHGQMRKGMLLQFLGELQREEGMVSETVCRGFALFLNFLFL